MTVENKPKKKRSNVYSPKRVGNEKRKILFSDKEFLREKKR